MEFVDYERASSGAVLVEHQPEPLAEMLGARRSTSLLVRLDGRGESRRTTRRSR